MKEVTFDKLQARLDNVKQKYGVPFCRCRVIKEGKIIYDHAAGDNEQGKDLYYIYSMTKLITSVATMRLVEQGKLSLEDEVSKYLPEAAHITIMSENGPVPAKEKMTVRHLVSMQGGYNYARNIEELEDAITKNPNASTMEIATALLKHPLDYEPGQGFKYSLCYDVLGAVLENASGMHLGEYLRKEIFEPLKMTDTTFRVTQEMRKRFIAEYRYNPETRRIEQMIPETNVFIFTTEYESAGAGLISTFEDYFKFVTTIMNGGVTKDGYQLISRASLDEMTKRTMTDEMLNKYNRYKQWGCGYSFGVRVQLEKEMCPPGMDVGVFEITGAAGSYAHFDLKNELAILYFQHTLGVAEVIENFHHEVRNLVYEELQA